MSGVHSMSLGAVSSVESANKYLGVPNIKHCPGYTTYLAICARERYYKKHGRSLSYHKAKFNSESKETTPALLQSQQVFDRNTGSQCAPRPPI